MKRYYVSDFPAAMVITPISIDIAERVSNAISTLAADYELLHHTEFDPYMYRLVVAELKPGIVTVNLVNVADNTVMAEDIKRPMGPCSAEEYYKCDCRYCDRKCRHRDAFRRLPKSFGGYGFCENLRK